MNSDQVLDVLDELGKTASLNARLERLKQVIDDPLFAKVARAACDPFITYGIKSAIPTPAGGCEMFGEAGSTFSFLDSLASRKITGNLARAALEGLYTKLSRKSAELIWRIIHKDLRCGVTATMLNKARPEFIPVFEVMLAAKFEEKRILGRVMVAEPKKDGVRVICIVKDNEAQFFSRTGKPFPAVAHLGPIIAEQVELAWDAALLNNDRDMLDLLHGEQGVSVVFDGEVTSGSFLKTVGDIRRKDEKAADAVFEIFDVLPYDDFAMKDEIEIAAWIRRRNLEVFFKTVTTDRLALIERRKVANVAECHRAYADWQAQGFEGAMIKDDGAHYFKKRSPAWLKMKACDTLDLRVVDAFEGEGKYVGKLGGLIVDNNGVRVRVGGGFSDEQRDVFWKLVQVDRNSPELPGEILGHLIEVAYHEQTSDGSLRHPRFITFRFDKDKGIAA